MKQILFMILTGLLSISVYAQADVKTKIDANLMFVGKDIQRAIDDPKNSTSDDVQKLLFEPEVWKAELAKIINATPDQFPADWRSTVQSRLDQLSKLINDGAPSRSWVPPPFSRPVEEGMAKTKFLAYYKGASVLKIGSNYKDWNMFKNSLGIPTNRFVRGIALLKIPKRPFCQVQEWIVKQTYAGGRWSAAKVESFGGGGVFVKCE